MREHRLMIEPTILQRQRKDLEIAADTGKQPPRPRQLRRPSRGQRNRHRDAIAHTASQILILDAATLFRPPVKYVTSAASQSPGFQV